MYSSRYSLFVGRYQPFHEGHKWLIQQRLDLGKNVCIAIRTVGYGIIEHKPTENIKQISATKIRKKLKL